MGSQSWGPLSDGGAGQRGLQHLRGAISQLVNRRAPACLAPLTSIPSLAGAGEPWSEERGPGEDLCSSKGDLPAL